MIKSLQNKYSISEKLKVDTFWNLFSYLIIGLCGITLPLLTAKYFNPNILGILNTSLIILTICSQISGFGIHFSVLKYVSEHYKDIEKVCTIMLSSLLLVSFTSLIFTLLFFILINPINSLFPEKNMYMGLLLITPALYLLSVNKVLLGYYNANRKMKLFAIVNTVRYLNWIIVLLIFIIHDLPSLYLPILFAISESVVFLINLPVVLFFFKYYDSKNLRNWVEKHFTFGIKAMHGAIFVDFNSRADVLAVGIFTNTYMTGIYTIASMLVDGFIQLTIVLRIIINPLITKYYVEFGKGELLMQLKKGKLLFYIIGTPLIIFTIILFPFIIDIFNISSDYKIAYLPLIITLIGLMLSFGYQPFQMIFVQTGYPLVQTVFWGVILFLNILLSVFFVYKYGIIGAGIVSSIIYLTIPVLLNVFTNKFLKFKF